MRARMHLHLKKSSCVIFDGGKESASKRTPWNSRGVEGKWEDFRNITIHNEKHFYNICARKLLISMQPIIREKFLIISLFGRFFKFPFCFSWGLARVKNFHSSFDELVYGKLSAVGWWDIIQFQFIYFYSPNSTQPLPGCKELIHHNARLSVILSNANKNGKTKAIIRDAKFGLTWLEFIAPDRLWRKSTKNLGDSTAYNVITMENYLKLGWKLENTVWLIFQ